MTARRMTRHGKRPCPNCGAMVATAAYEAHRSSKKCRDEAARLNKRREDARLARKVGA